MNLLFVVTAFYPEQAVGSIRTTKFVKFLHLSGHQVTVLSLPPAPWAKRDESLWFPALTDISWETIPQSSFFDRVFAQARSSVVGDKSAVDVTNATGPSSLKGFVGRLKKSTQFAYTVCKAFDWVAQVRRHARSELSGRKFDAIFTSYPSLASPLAGLALKRMGLCDTLMIDFRDPISYGSTSRWSFRRLLERWFVRCADITSYASAGVCRKIVGVATSDDATANVVTNGFDPEDSAAIEAAEGMPLDSEAVNFSYVGSLYGGKRDLGPFFRALSEVMRRRVERRPNIYIHYAGHEGAIFRGQAKAYGLDGLVINHGPVSRNSSLWLQNAADICVISTWNTAADQGILTGKMFETFLLRKPLIAIVSGTVPGSETREIVERTGAGICFEEAVPEDFSRLAEWIEASINEKLDTGRIKDAYTQAVHDYNIQIAVAKLFKSITSIKDRRC